MSRSDSFFNASGLAVVLAGCALLSGCVVAPIGPRPAVIRPAPLYLEPAALVVVPAPPPRVYYWHHGRRYWR